MSLKYLFKQLSLNSRQARWMEFLCEFDFEIKHVKEKEGKVADALSIKFYVATVSVWKRDLTTSILEALANNEFYLQVRGYFQKGQSSKKYEGYRIEENGILLHQNKMYVSRDMHDDVCNSVHDAGNRKRNSETIVFTPVIMTVFMKDILVAWVEERQYWMNRIKHHTQHTQATQRR